MLSPTLCKPRSVLGATTSQGSVQLHMPLGGPGGPTPNHTATTEYGYVPLTVGGSFEGALRLLGLLCLEIVAASDSGKIGLAAGETATAEMST